MSYWEPETQTLPRPSAEQLTEQAAYQADVGLDEPTANLRGRILYLRSYLLMRATIGFIGVALPIALLVGDWLVLAGEPGAKGSLSAYYHSGVRDLFVGSLAVTAIFLVTYKVFEHNLDNTLSIIAGFAALGVALFPTRRPKDSGIPLTPLQDRFGETPVAATHYVSAAIFLTALAVISFYFGVREGNRPQRGDGRKARMSPTFWRRFHWACSAAIALAVVFIVVTKLTGWVDEYSLIIGEAIAAFAFGLSWLMKGLELNVLLGPKVAERLGVS